MCGIYGEVRLSGSNRIGTAGEHCLAALTHRGPDASGHWSDADVWLGSRRLSIIDIAGGDQPIWNRAETLCIVYNGELYNMPELRSQLEGLGHTFRTRSDTEVVLQSYERWGPDCLQRFNGMFAFAIWDRSDRALFLARDRLGEKPLYIYDDGRRLVFASEIKAIVADRSIPRDVDVDGLSNFLTFGHSVAAQTMFRGVTKLLPGHYAIVKDGRASFTRYWDVGWTEVDRLSDEDFDRELVRLLDDSVEMRLLADVPVGAFLSGGIDSTAVVALMKRHAADVSTFSLGFDLSGEYDQLEEARTVAHHLGTQHHELRVEHFDLVETLRRLVYHYDEPFGDAAAFPVYLLSKFAREHVKVVLAGDGGDELFGGYRRYTADRFAGWYQKLPRPLSDVLIPRAVGGMPRLRRLKRTVATLPIEEPGRRYANWLVVFDPELRYELTHRSEAVDPVVPYAACYEHLDGHAVADHLNRIMYVDLKRILPDAYLEKVDKATMAASLEARVPLLDHRIAELAFAIPGSKKVKGLQTKVVLKRALRGLVPDWVLNRPKRGFSVPTDPWFRGPLKSFAFDILLDDRARQRGYFDHGVVERIWREHEEGRHVRDHQLWLLLNFELWSRIYIDGESV